MTPDDLRAIMGYLRRRVQLADREAGTVTVRFAAPTVQEVTAAGLDVAGYESLVATPWWDEMVTDIVETPEMCEPGDSPEQVLEYARDVVSEYVRKRATL